jgi:hypothetical protein
MVLESPEPMTHIQKGENKHFVKLSRPRRSHISCKQTLRGDKMSKKINILAAIVLALVCFMPVANISAAVVTVDGVMDGSDSYTNSFTAKWTNGHQTANSVYNDWGDETTVWWTTDADNMYLYIEVPLYAKAMVYGDGCDTACTAEYFDHWDTHHNGTLDMNYMTATGSERTEFDVIFGGGNYEGKLQGASTGAGITDYASSLEWLLGNATCDMIDCAASTVEMSFEFALDLNVVDVNNIIASIEEPAEGLIFHLSPERRIDGFAPVPVPAAVWLLGSALALLGWTRRKTT